MTARSTVRRLPNGRLHLSDGPIDLIVEAEGAPEAVRAASEALAERFGSVLDELCAELPLLRAEARPGSARASGPIARRMQDAVAPHARHAFVTPMAAVAGAVADAMVETMMRAAPLRRAMVNNGGDIAFALTPGRSVTIALADRPDEPVLFGRVRVDAGNPVRGVATSGRHGRSFSLGIADAVTVLARCAAEADAAATLIANAVDLPGHPAVTRAPAFSIQPDSDLGDRLVTRAVGFLRADEVGQALDAGEACAARMLEEGLIEAAVLRLAGVTRTLGTLALDDLQPILNPSLQPGAAHA